HVGPGGRDLLGGDDGPGRVASYHGTPSSASARTPAVLSFILQEGSGEGKGMGRALGGVGGPFRAGGGVGGGEEAGKRAWLLPTRLFQDPFDPLLHQVQPLGPRLEVAELAFPVKDVVGRGELVLKAIADAQPGINGHG